MLIFVISFTLLSLFSSNECHYDAFLFRTFKLRLSKQKLNKQNKKKTLKFSIMEMFLLFLCRRFLIGKCFVLQLNKQAKQQFFFNFW